MSFLGTGSSPHLIPYQHIEEDIIYMVLNTYLLDKITSGCGKQLSEPYIAENWKYIQV